MNAYVLFLHIFTVSGLTLFALRLGKEAMIAWVCLMATASNLFILKEIPIFGLKATCTDSLAVGYLLGLNLIQEFFGLKEARKTIWTVFFIVFAFFCLSFFQLTYMPVRDDASHAHYAFLLEPIPRIILASLGSFFFVQLIDLIVFGYLRKKMNGKYFPIRAFSSSLLCEAIDTIVFSYLALSGIYSALWELITISFALKVITLLISTPFLMLSKKVVHGRIHI